VIEGYYGFGQVAGDRLNPAETRFAVYPGLLPWWLVTLVFAGIYVIIFSRKADYSLPRPAVAFAGLTVTIFLLYNRGYSPQFLVYLLPFIVLLFPDVRGLAYALFLTGLNILEQPVYFVLLPNATWLLTLVVVARFLALVVLALEFSLVIWPAEARLAWAARLQPAVPLAIGGLLLLALVVLAPLLLRSYTTGRLVGTPLGTFVGFMEVQAEQAGASGGDGAGEPRLLVSDQITYRQIYPYLRGDFEVALVGGADQYSGSPRIVDYLQGRDRVWILPTGPQQQRLANTVADRGQPVASFDFEELGTASLYNLRGGAPAPFMPPARFSAGIELLAHDVDVRGGAVDIRLYWRTRDPVNQSFVVFTHLLDAEGQWVAGHDSIPMNGAAPTSGWPVDAVQADRHRIRLPSDLPPGEYTVVAGLYLQDHPDARLTGTDPEGLALPGQAVPLEVLQLP
jgi:hypothetical protein